MNILKIVLGTLIFTVTITATIAQETCQPLIQSYIDSTLAACADLGDDQACFGNRFLNGYPATQYINEPFEAPGERVDTAAIEWYEVLPFIPDDESWGILQTRVITESGQAIEMTAFGSQDIWDAALTSPTELTGTVLTSSDLLKAPADYGTAFYPLMTDDPIRITAKEFNNQWVRVIDRLGQAGWVESQMLSYEGDLNSLPLLDPFFSLDPTSLPPMQGLFVRGNPDMVDINCVDVPISGMLIQAPEATEPVNIWINAVNIEFDGTMYITSNIQDGSMWIEVLSGTSKLVEYPLAICDPETLENCTPLVIPAGARASIIVYDNYFIEWDRLSAYDLENAMKLPLQLLSQSIELPKQLTPAEIQAAQE